MARSNTLGQSESRLQNDVICCCWQRPANDRYSIIDSMSLFIQNHVFEYHGMVFIVSCMYFKSGANVVVWAVKQSSFR